MLHRQPLAYAGCNTGPHSLKGISASNVHSNSAYQGLYEGSDFGKGILQYKTAALGLSRCCKGCAHVRLNGLQLHEALHLCFPSLR